MTRYLRIVRAMAVCAAMLPGIAHSARVYITSSGNTTQDSTVVSSLASAGHTGVIGLTHIQFDGTQSLTGFDAVLLQPNYNWFIGDMPLAGQAQLVAFVQQGGGLVTTEWLLWLTASGNFQTLKQAMPAVETSSYNGDTTHHFVQATPNNTINSGIPADFVLPGDNAQGSETNVAAVKANATVFYNTVNNGLFVGLCGWDFGNGRVAQFSQTVGEGHLSDPIGFRLTGNVVEWVLHGAGSIQINPTSVVVRLGQINSGGLGQISDIDGQALRVCKFIVPNQQVAPITVEVNGTSPVASPTQFQFRTFSRMSITGSFSETIDLFDWNLNNFSPSAVFTATLGTTYVPIGVAADVPVSRFVGSGNAIRARYRIRQVGPASSAFWCCDMDQAVWFVRP